MIGFKATHARTPAVDLRPPAQTDRRYGWSSIALPRSCISSSHSLPRSGAKKVSFDGSADARHSDYNKENTMAAKRSETRPRMGHKAESAVGGPIPTVAEHKLYSRKDEKTKAAPPPAVHPFLASPHPSIVYDVRLPPTALHLHPPYPSPSPSSLYTHLTAPLHPAHPRRIRLISRAFPWAFDLAYAHRGITCLDVLAALHSALQAPLADAEWGAADEERRAGLRRARERRVGMVVGVGVGTDVGVDVDVGKRLGMGARVGTGTGESRGLLRVDWLGRRTVFAGLVRDEEFARRRLYPGSECPPETWVVEFRRGC
ncbi:hypothetical protein BV22DRAFT_1160389 [Leucogyrophana mollusca]|uniref:Uncharacterized protein n=1 Tax=Leucogyrophana mollusca TaxID=85980 RepID=A0ACB8BLC2_9AGAM|nr:hypothetical protein BV22DRAFT_1160389 [Leucogyrophana mollusca]